MTYFLIEIQIFILVTLISCSKDLNFRIFYEKLYLFYRKNYNISHNDLRKKNHVLMTVSQKFKLNYEKASH